VGAEQSYPEETSPARDPTTTRQRHYRIRGGTPDPFARHHHQGMIDVAAAHSDDEQNQDTHHIHGHVSLVDKLHGAAENGRSRLGMRGPWGESGVVEPAAAAAAAQYIAVGEQQPSVGRCLVPADKKKREEARVLGCVPSK